MSNKIGSKFSVVLFGEAWDDMWRRRQQLAHKLAQLDVVDKVIYVEQPLTLYSLLKYVFGRGYASARVIWDRVIQNKSLVHQVNNKLYVVTPLTLLPRLNSRLLNFIDFPFRLHIQFYLIKRLVAKLGLNDLVMWVGIPWIPVELLQKFGQRLTWYDFTEDYKVQPSLSPLYRRYIARNEDYMMTHADVVSSVSRRTYHQNLDQRLDSVWLPAGVDIEPFTREISKDVPEDIGAIGTPVVGFVGEINVKVDLDLLEYLAQTRPSWSMVLIGNIGISDEALSRLKSYPSIHFLGRKPYESLPAYLNHFDVGIHTYKQDEIGNMSIESAQKLYLYLASGMPVVAYFPSGMEDVHEGLVQNYISKEEFVAGIEHALAFDTDELRQRRIEYAEENSWAARAEQIASLISDRLEVL